MTTTQEFIDHTFKSTFIKLTLSKPRAFSPYKNILIRKVKIQGKEKYQVTYRTVDKDQVQNFLKDDLNIQLQLWLLQNFFFADMITKKEEIRLMQSKKGKVTITRKKATHEDQSQSHDKEKQRLIPANSSFLQALGITSSNGKIHSHAQKKYKQINKYVELMKDLLNGEPIHKIVDMGSGKGYLTFALYNYLYRQNKKLIVEGIELRQDLVDKSNEVVNSLGMKGISFRQGSIEEIQLKDVDMVIALHACDIATDMAIAKGVKAKASYIAVAPCCHKQIRKNMTSPKNAVAPILIHGILKERVAEMVTDTIRALLLESVGYKTKIFEFISLEHTPKNIMITAKYSGKGDPGALKKIEELKKEFGIKEHYLESLL